MGIKALKTWQGEHFATGEPFNLDKHKRNIIGSSSALGVETGVEKMFDLDDPGTYTRDEIEWAQELGATTDEEIAEYIAEHKQRGEVEQ